MQQKHSKREDVAFCAVKFVQNQTPKPMQSLVGTRRAKAAVYALNFYAPRLSGGKVEPKRVGKYGTSKKTFPDAHVNVMMYMKYEVCTCKVEMS